MQNARHLWDQWPSYVSRRLPRLGFREKSKWGILVLDSQENLVWNLRHSSRTQSCGVQNGAELSNDLLVPCRKNRPHFACFSWEVHNTALIVVGLAWCIFDIPWMELRWRFDKLQQLMAERLKVWCRIHFVGHTVLAVRNHIHPHLYVVFYVLVVSVLHIQLFLVALLLRTWQGPRTLRAQAYEWLSQLDAWRRVLNCLI